MKLAVTVSLTAAFFIPGVGPLITAGAFASTLGFAGGAAASALAIRVMP